MKRNITIGMAAVLISGIMCGCSSEAPTWTGEGLQSLVPAPNATLSSLHEYTDNLNFDMKGDDVSQTTFDSYVSSCKEMGWNESYGLDSSWKAESRSGAEINITYYSSLNEVSVRLDADVNTLSLYWPLIYSSVKFPEVEDGHGKVTYNELDGFYAIIDETDSSFFTDYVAQCQTEDYGFTLDAENADTSYMAYNTDGDYIIITKVSDTETTIDVYADKREPAETEEETTETEETEEKTEETTTDQTEEQTTDATDTAATTATEETAETKEVMVWITEGGSKYHRKSDCSGMENATQISLEDAKAQGYTQCKRCY